MDQPIFPNPNTMPSRSYWAISKIVVSAFNKLLSNNNGNCVNIEQEKYELKQTYKKNLKYLFIRWVVVQFVIVYALNNNPNNYINDYLFRIIKSSKRFILYFIFQS